VAKESKAKKQDPIHKIELSDGTTRYRFVIDVGEKPDGKRDQRTFTYDTYREAKAERAKIIAGRSTGTYVPPTKVKVGETIDAWLEGKRNVGPGTLRTYTDRLQHAKDRIGHLQMQKVNKANVDRMVTDMHSSGRRVGNKQTQALSPTTVNGTLRLLAAVFDDAMVQGIIGRNVVKLVQRLPMVKQEMQTWTAEQAAAFLQTVADDRLSAAWQISLYGLRRSEVLGLRWSDVDLAKKRLTVNNARKSVAGVIVEGDPKTERSKRTLPLDDGLVAALSVLQLRQRDEAEKAGDAYQPNCPLCGGSHVIADELGRPLFPQGYSDRFEVLAIRAKLPVIRLHDARHTCGTLMHLRGVKTAVVSAWLGHSSASFTMATYVHSQDDALTAAGETLSGAYAAPKAVEKIQ
jgi:integrase